MHNILKFTNRQNSTEFSYAGRPIAASTAVGFAKTHNQQLRDLIDAAFK
jgi:2-oxoglutarate dehydrogenase complex dehydrogenase (E1) component-like enzyme